ncbi:MAG: hypothetical protein ACRD68_01485, partial [Pyrinomonadaceae bacterium]
MTIQEGPRCCVYVSQPGRAAEFITLHAEGRDPGGSYDWTAADPAVVRVVGSGSSATVTGLATGITEVRVTYACPGGRQAQATIRCIAYGVGIARPTGDPVNNGSADNEFTFNRATPGVLAVPCEARITPNDPDATACVEPHLRWSIDAVGASALTWNTPSPADPAQGLGVNATATFTGLPNLNDEFGAKTVTLSIEGIGAVATTTIEVFWAKTATNHPDPGQGSTPNWFFYWKQVIEALEGTTFDNLRYGGRDPGGNLGETPSMLRWTYATAQNKRRIIMFDASSTTDNAVPAIHGRLTG